MAYGFGKRPGTTYVGKLPAAIDPGNSEEVRAFLRHLAACMEVHTEVGMALLGQTPEEPEEGPGEVA